MARTSKPPEERKREIIETAKKLFSQKGYANIQMGDISKEIGVAHGLVYHYFKSKNEIFDVVIDELFEEELSAILNVYNDEKLDPVEKINVIFDAYREGMSDLSTKAGYMGVEENIESYERILKRKIDILLPHFERFIIQGCESGHFDCSYPKQAAYFCLYGEMAIEMHHSGNMDDLLNAIKEMYKRILGIKEPLR
jgi:AcrR family transcriptional regulator